MSSGFKHPGLNFPLLNLVFLRQEGNQSESLSEATPSRCHSCLVRGQSLGFLRGDAELLLPSLFKVLSALDAHGRRELHCLEPHVGVKELCCHDCLVCTKTSLLP